jgi:prephenate dehydratase
VIPFENSTYGPVVDTLDLLATAPTAYPALSVVAESYIAVHHALVGRRPPDSSPVPSQAALAHASASKVKPASTLSSGTATPTPSQPHPPAPRSKPVTSLDHITRVFTHPQAFGQCAAFLAAYLKHTERQETASTAAAAARVAEHDGIDEAAIASEAAAQLRGLDVLASEIEDKVGNRTRFATIRKRGTDPLASQPHEAGIKFKTLISFTLRPAAPAGALAGALAAFTAHGLNLTSIHSRPSGRRAWDYVFFVECQSENAEDGDGDEDFDERVKGAMELLKERVEGCFCHGRYKARE